MRSLLAGFSLSIALLVPVVASAATVYEVNTTGATQTGSKNNDVYIGQAFDSGTNTQLTSADLQINSGTFASGSFVLSLHLTTGSPGAYFASGSPLVSATFSNTILSPTLDSFYNFNNLNWALSPSTVYMIGIQSETSPTVRWTLNQSATRNSSTGFITGYSGYNAQEGSNVDNGLHGATIAAVPEPSSLASVAAAVIGLAAGLRRYGPRRVTSTALTR